jgi:hypothetical protein
MCVSIGFDRPAPSARCATPRVFIFGRAAAMLWKASHSPIERAAIAGLDL